MLGARLLIVALATAIGGSARATTFLDENGTLPSKSEVFHFLPGEYDFHLTTSAPVSVDLTGTVDRSYGEYFEGMDYDGDDDPSFPMADYEISNTTDVMLEVDVPQDQIVNSAVGGYLFMYNYFDPVINLNLQGAPGTQYSLTVTGRLAPPPNVPEPDTWALMLIGFGLAGGALRLRDVARGAPRLAGV
jgi:hypothetical protein